MEKDEKILLAVAFVALVAIIVAKVRHAGGVFVEPIAQTNLTYNQPSFVSSPLANVLPTSALTPGVPSVSDEFMYGSDCGCFA